MPYRFSVMVFRGYGMSSLPKITIEVRTLLPLTAYNG
jgi:hypothetical protein